MYKAWAAIRGMAAAVGFILLFLGAQTSDYYVIELGKAEPAGTWETMILGVLLLMPMLIHSIIKEMQGCDEDED